MKAIMAGAATELLMRFYPEARDLFARERRLHTEIASGSEADPG
jgi:hypothetical protein